MFAVARARPGQSWTLNSGSKLLELSRLPPGVCISRELEPGLGPGQSDGVVGLARLSTLALVIT